ncbi:hypothetical protein QBC40DRAFT_337175 [Triangularia verruculosa]|uniref:Pentatricopeptide repeat-containing protein n=1 Tax=Triangularia verruculosa TaxID=2587418 RepID=A0AAN6XPH2_9PEZI|nr:hypothetical protein QBC40DRAFT_337175 [Triangularia verruculosa]
MPPNLPVPSKAALTALQGLVVGTTCTIAIIAEDRRRRINSALRIVENSERIKSCRQYRPGGGSAIARQLQEQAVQVDEDPLVLLPAEEGKVEEECEHARAEKEVSKAIGTSPTSFEAGGGSTTRDARPAESPGTDPFAELKAAVRQTERNKGTKKNPSPQVPEWFKEHQASAQSRSFRDFSSIQRRATLGASVPNAPTATVSAGQKVEYITRSEVQDAEPETGPNASLAWLETVKSLQFPSTIRILTLIQEACITKDTSHLRTVVQYVLDNPESAVVGNTGWLDGTALLCKTCQGVGMVEEAGNILVRALRSGKINEVDYYAFEPSSLIRSLLTRAEAVKANREAHLRILDLAAVIYRPKIAEKTELHPDLYETGRRLLEARFSVDHLIIGREIYRRCHSYALRMGDTTPEFTHWYLTKLVEQHSYKMAIQTFRFNYANCSPDSVSLYDIARLAVDCVEKAHNHRADDVLRTLVKLYQSIDFKMPSELATRLLVAYWRKNKDFTATQKMFDSFTEVDIREAVLYPDALYRVMVEISLEARQEAIAEWYFEKSAAEGFVVAEDVRVLGVFARHHASLGDWDAVKALFQRMRASEDPEGMKNYSQVFVPVLKAYAEGHTVEETDAFLKSYVEEMKVPLNNYIFTLMGTRYAQLRDVDKIVKWLEFCSKLGFEVDAAFSNVILTVLRREWKMPFRDLRTLYRKLRLLNPKFSDRYTELVMVRAALADGSSGRAARGRLLSLRVQRNILPHKGRCADAREVALVMKEYLTYGNPRIALRMYKVCRNEGMDVSQGTLRLAVQAQLQAEPNNYQDAYELVRDAQDNGLETEGVINYIVGSKIRNLFTNMKKERKAWHPSRMMVVIQDNLKSMEELGISPTDTALHQAARICLTMRFYSGAIVYAAHAAKARGEAPCYNLANFSIILTAATKLLDVTRLKLAIGRALSSTYKEDTACLNLLKTAFTYVKRFEPNPESTTAKSRQEQAHEVLERAIEAIIQARKTLRIDAKRLGTDALRVMRESAIAAGCPPVDFNEIPWLNSTYIKDDVLDSGKGFRAEDGSQLVLTRA